MSYIKRASKLIIVIICLIAFALSLGLTNSRYYLSATLSGDFLKPLGSIFAHHFEWVWGYKGVDGDGGASYFEIETIPIEYGNIRYAVSNKFNSKINRVENQEYYIRIVADDGTADIPVTYSLHEVDKTDQAALPLTAGIGYGPFPLATGIETITYYSLKVSFVKTDNKYTHTEQKMHVQMVRLMYDNVSLEVMGSAPLNMKWLYKVNVALAYYRLGAGENGGNLYLGGQTVKVDAGAEFDFTNLAALAALGVDTSYFTSNTFSDVRSALSSWAAVTKITLPAGSAESRYIEVYFT